jgi:hypothetical protein
MSVLIITIKGDEHAITVAGAIRRMGGVCDIWWTSDFPTAQHHEFRTEPGGLSLRVATNVLRFDRYRSIWVRRLPMPRPNSAILHPDDVKFVDQSPAALPQRPVAFSQLPERHHGERWSRRIKFAAEAPIARLSRCVVRLPCFEVSAAMLNGRWCRY